MLKHESNFNLRFISWKKHYYNINAIIESYDPIQHVTNCWQRLLLKQQLSAFQEHFCKVCIAHFRFVALTWWLLLWLLACCCTHLFWLGCCVSLQWSGHHGQLCSAFTSRTTYSPWNRRDMIMLWWLKSNKKYEMSKYGKRLCNLKLMQYII